MRVSYLHKFKNMNNFAVIFLLATGILIEYANAGNDKYFYIGFFVGFFVFVFVFVSKTNNCLTQFLRHSIYWI